MGKMTTYGVGGYDPTKPNNNIVEQVETEDVVIEHEENQTVSIPKTAITDLAAAMTDPSINSIAEIKTAIISFTEKIQ